MVCSGDRGSEARAYRPRAILLWLHNGLGYIYDSIGFNGLMAAPTGYAAKGREYEHRAIHRQ
jgi:hypothetical protein